MSNQWNDQRSRHIIGGFSGCVTPFSSDAEVRCYRITWAETQSWLGFLGRTQKFPRLHTIKDCSKFMLSSIPKHHQVAHHQNHV